MALRSEFRAQIGHLGDGPMWPRFFAPAGGAPTSMAPGGPEVGASGRTGRGGAGGDRGACPAHAWEPFFEPGLSQRAKKAEKLVFALSSMAFTSSSCR